MGKCSSHTAAGLRLHRKSYKKWPRALSLTLGCGGSGSLVGKQQCTQAACMICGQATTPFQPWNFWLPFPTHWSQHRKTELRNNLSIYTVTDSNSLRFHFITQYSMARNHNIALERLALRKLLSRAHSWSVMQKEKKKKIRIERKLPSLG